MYNPRMVENVESTQYTIQIPTADGNGVTQVEAIATTTPLNPAKLKDGFYHLPLAEEGVNIFSGSVGLEPQPADH